MKALRRPPTRSLRGNACAAGLPLRMADGRRSNASRQPRAPCIAGLSRAAAFSVCWSRRDVLWTEREQWQIHHHLTSLSSTLYGGIDQNKFPTYGLCNVQGGAGQSARDDGRAS